MTYNFTAYNTLHYELHRYNVITETNQNFP